MNPVNDPPVLMDDTYNVTEDTTKILDVLTNDSDVEGLDISTIFVTVPPLHGSTGANPATGEITYVPANNYAGPDTFQYRIRDIGDNGAPAIIATATVNITVDAVNDPPVAADDLASTEAGATIVIDVLGNDSDVESDLDVNISIVTPPPASEGTIESIDPVTGAVTFRADDNFTGGVTSFVYEVFDTGLPLPALSSTATVRVAVSQTDIEVDTLVDEDDGDFGPGSFSLREAFSLIGHDGTITFAPSIIAPGLSTISLTPGK